MTKVLNSTQIYILLVFIILFILMTPDTKPKLLVVIILTFLFIIFYIKNKQMSLQKSNSTIIENYKPNYPQLMRDNNKFTKNPEPVSMSINSKQLRTLPSLSKLNNSGKFCNDSLVLDSNLAYQGVYNNEYYTSANQMLAGPPNPKTLIPPVIVPPVVDLSYWKANNMVHFSNINEPSQIDVYKSGYQVSTCCGNMNGKIAIPEGVEPQKTYWSTDYSGGCGNTQNLKENFVHQGIHRTPLNHQEYNLQEREIREAEDAQYAQQYNAMYNTSNQYQDASKQLQDYPMNYGQVNTTCGYNPEQLYNAGLPANLSSGNCERDPIMKNYNNNLFTQIIQPGIYTRNEVNEPINSNIGISFTQQFEPTTCNVNPQNGDIMFTEHDPLQYTPPARGPNMNVINSVNEANMYDPRFTGYGTSYRSYIDNTTGQPRFYYDDIDAIRMPNYIVRSNIDHQPFADSYGPIPGDGENGNAWNPEIRALANNAFTNAAIEFRTDLSERLMRKINANAWQRRVAPISTSGQRMAGTRRM